MMSKYSIDFLHIWPGTQGTRSRTKDFRSRLELQRSVVETAVFAQWLHSSRDVSNLHYARWKGGKGEVDMVSPRSWCVEIKWSDRFFDNPSELKSLDEFLQKSKHSEVPSVTTRTKRGSKRLASGNSVEFLESAIYCYTVGHNLISGREKLR